MLFCNESFPFDYENEELMDLEDRWLCFASGCLTDGNEADPEDLQDLLVDTYPFLREICGSDGIVIKENGADMAKFIFSLGQAYQALSSVWFNGEDYVGPDEMAAYAHFLHVFWMSFFNGGWQTSDDGLLRMSLFKTPPITIDPETFELTEDVMARL